MEVPDLSLSTIWNLDNHISVVDQVKVSVLWQFRNNIEVSLDVKTELFVELSLDGFTLPFINIDDVPLLVDFTMCLVNNDVLLFSVNSTSNIKYLGILDVPNESTFKLEELPPS